MISLANFNQVVLLPQQNPTLQISVESDTPLSAQAAVVANVISPWTGAAQEVCTGYNPRSLPLHVSLRQD